MTKGSIFVVILAAVLYTQGTPVPQTPSVFSSFLSLDPTVAFHFKRFIIDWLRANNTDDLPESVFKQLEENDDFFRQHFHEFFKQEGLRLPSPSSGTSNSGSTGTIYRSEIIGTSGDKGSFETSGWTSISQPGVGTKIDMFVNKDGSTYHKQEVYPTA